MRREFLRSSLAATFAIGTAALAGEARAQAAGDPIPVGVIANLTGTDVRSSVHMVRGVELAVEEVNASGGINGRPLRLITEDSAYRPQEALDAANKLYEINKVEAAIMFGGSGLMLAVAPIVQQKGKVLINTSSSSSRLGDFPGTLFSVLPLDDIMGKELGAWVASRGVKNAAFIVPNNTFGNGLMNAAAAAFEAAGGKVTRRMAYTEGQPDYRADLQGLAQTRPEAIISAGYGDDSHTVFRNARELALNVPWYAAYPTIFKIENPAYLDGKFFGVDNGGHHVASGQALRARYVQKHGGNEEPLAHVFYGYDALMLVARAMKDGGPNAAGIKASIAKVAKEHSGATGRIEWDARGQRVNPPINLVEYKGGKFAVMQTKQ